jgi:hypothetical protein
MSELVCRLSDRRERLPLRLALRPRGKRRIGHRRAAAQVPLDVGDRLGAELVVAEPPLPGSFSSEAFFPVASIVLEEPAAGEASLMDFLHASNEGQR